MDDEKRHILRVDGEAMIAALMEHKGWLAQNVVRQLLLKHNTSLLNEILDDPVLRNNIYMAEKAKRDARGGEKRERQHQYEIEKKRRHEQFLASKNYRQSVEYIHNVLGWNDEEGIQET